MKIFFVAILIASGCQMAFSQKQKEINYFRFGANENNWKDSSLWIRAISNDGIVTFTTPGSKESFFNDTALEKMFTVPPSTYGPYKFKKYKNGIFFIKNGKWKNYRRLYSLNKAPFFSYEIFSNDLNEKIEMTYLGMSPLDIGNKTVTCYRFFQESRGIDSYPKIIYIDKSSLLPIKFESYKDQDMKTCVSYIKATNW